MRGYQLDPDLLLDFNSVGVERIIPYIEVRNQRLLHMYNNRGRVYKPFTSPKTNQTAMTSPPLKRRKISLEPTKNKFSKPVPVNNV